MKILIVDDDPRLRELVGLSLERAGFSVITSGDGQRALVHAAREAPDLIVLDVGLPEMEGFEVCRRIRAQSDVPILFLTARDDEIDRVLGLELGADDYVSKPFSPRELVARVRAILKRSTGGARQAVLREVVEMISDERAHAGEERVVGGVGRVGLHRAKLEEQALGDVAGGDAGGFEDELDGLQGFFEAIEGEAQVCRGLGEDFVE